MHGMKTNALRLMTAFAFVTALVPATAAPAGSPAAEPKIGEPFELKFTDVDGKKFDLATLKGKVILIDFWATWCGPCVAEVPKVLRTYEKLHAKGFEIVGISLDSDKAKLTRFTKEKGMTWPQYFDGQEWNNKISTRFGIDSIPAMWLVDKDGKLASIDARGGLEMLVEQLLAK